MHIKAHQAEEDSDPLCSASWARAEHVKHGIALLHPPLHFAGRGDEYWCTRKL